MKACHNSGQLSITQPHTPPASNHHLTHRHRHTRILHHMPSHTREVRRWNNLLPHADHVHTHTLTHNCALHQPNTIHAAPHLRFKLYYGAEQPAPPADQQLLGHPSGHRAACRPLHGSRRPQTDLFPFQPTKRWVPSTLDGLR
jgi:hypothetical protein